MIDKFSDRFCHCNPKLGLDKGKNLMGIVIYMTKWVLILYFSVVVGENGQGYFSSQYELVPSECKLSLVKGSLEYLLSMFHIMALSSLLVLLLSCKHSVQLCCVLFFFHLIFNVYFMLYIHESLYCISAFSLCFFFIRLKGFQLQIHR